MVCFFRRTLAYLKSACAVVRLPDEGTPLVVLADREDDPIIATAVGGKADVLASLDEHLYRPEVVAYCRSRGIEVMNDVELIRRLREEGEGPESS